MPITGLGVVCAAGGDAAQTLATFAGAAPRPAPATRLSTTLTCPVFQVADVPSAEPPAASRTFRLALAAARQALASAGQPHLEPGLRIGVAIGTTVASQLNDLEFYRAYRQTHRPPLGPVRAFLDGNLAAGLARRLGLRGPRLTVVNACSSGADAIGAALAWLRAGLCDAALAGGADELNRVPLCGFHSLGIMSDSPCAPFDRDRAGLNLGEGAGALLIETPDCARRRGASAELALAGYGAGCDAHHLTAPHPEGVGLELALRDALASAGAEPAEVAFVNAHGTATPDNDRVEGRVLGRLFGPDVIVSATKGYTGHTLGGAGAVEAVFAALALREGWVPASAGFETPDPEIPVRPVRRRTAVDGAVAVSTSLAFGGNNAALVLRRCGP